MIYSVVKIQVKGLTFSWFGINPFICLKWESVFGGCFFKISWKNFMQTKKEEIIAEFNKQQKARHLNGDGLEK